ncbi:MAG: AraC family transcriptional regulator [Clostridia bacterium]|nr:AraC family transcriptional regulator [Clostridia bacterium]
MKIFSCKYKGCLVHHSIDQHPNEQKFELHAHSYCEVFYFISGAGYYTVEGRNYPLTPGCVLLMRDGEIHKIHLDPDRPYERIAIHFRLDDVLGQGGAFAPLRSLILDRSPGCGNLFLANSKESEMFLNACFSRVCRSTRSNEELGMQLTATLPMILSELYAIRESSSSQELLTRREGDPVLTEVIDYINHNLTAIGSLSELQQRFFFSKSTLNRMFLESTGSTVWEYVIIKRLHAARRMLIDGKSAASAASACGFGDYSAFYRQYRRIFGESPCRERKSSKKE